MRTVVSLCFVSILMGCSAGGASWRQAKRADTSDAYARYLAAYPAHRRAGEGRVRLDELHWDDAQKRNDQAGYRAYVSAHPAGLHTQDARDRLEDLAYREAQADGSSEALDGFLALYGSGRFAEQAAKELEAQMWADAEAADTSEAYGAYVVRWPDGNHVEEAVIRREDAYWDEQKEADSLASYQAYMMKYPNGRHIPEANEALDTFRFSGVDVLVVMTDSWREGAKRNRSILDFRKEIDQSTGEWMRRAQFRTKVLATQDVKPNEVESWWLRLDETREDTALLVILYAEKQGRAFEPFGFATDSEAKVLLLPPGRMSPLWTAEFSESTPGEVRGVDKWALNKGAQEALADAILDARPPVRDYQRELD